MRPEIGMAGSENSFFLQLRREKISERMKLLQDLVPGCSKVSLSRGTKLRITVCLQF
jgi:hypothetical protein